ncbi:MAG: molecular chaperone [Clostridia bacterium]
MALTNYERETIINFNEEDKTASIYTYNPKLINRINAKVKEFPNIYRIVSVDKHGGITCEMPKDKLSIRLLSPVSEEFSKQASERAIKNKPLGSYLKSKSQD